MMTSETRATRRRERSRSAPCGSFSTPRLSADLAARASTTVTRALAPSIQAIIEAISRVSIWARNPEGSSHQVTRKSVSHSSGRRTCARKATARRSGLGVTRRAAWSSSASLASSSARNGGPRRRQTMNATTSSSHGTPTTVADQGEIPVGPPSRRERSHSVTNRRSYRAISPRCRTSALA